MGTGAGGLRISNFDQSALAEGETLAKVNGLIQSYYLIAPVTTVTDVDYTPSAANFIKFRKVLFTITANRTFTLRPASEWSGEFIFVKLVTTTGGAVLVIDPSGAELIDGAGTKVLSTSGSGFVMFSTGTAVVSLDFGGTGTSGLIVKEEGTTVTGGPHTTMNFIGTGVTAADAGAGQVNVTVSSGSSGLTFKEEGTTVTGGPHTTFNLIGSRITVADAGAAQANATVVEPRKQVLTPNTITGTDTTISTALSFAPLANTLMLFLNGELMREGATFDFTVSGTTVTWLASTGTGPDLDGTDVITYRYEA